MIQKLRNAGILLGVGMGGFVDGILFHQIFQLHNMLSNRYFPDTLANEQINMVWDGIFHAFTWVVTAVGIALLWKAVRMKNAALNSKVLLGSMALGWGIFNFVEGLIDHQLIGLHHVVERSAGGIQLFWDMLFLASGLALSAIGLSLIRRGKREIKSRENFRALSFPQAG